MFFIDHSEKTFTNLLLKKSNGSDDYFSDVFVDYNAKVYVPVGFRVLVSRVRKTVGEDGLLHESGSASPEVCLRVRCQGGHPHLMEGECIAWLLLLLLLLIMLVSSTRFRTRTYLRSIYVS